MIIKNRQQTKSAIAEIKKSILELEKVKDYISRLDNIQKHVFSRDGSVATSLRSWALNSISIKASEYLLGSKYKNSENHIIRKSKGCIYCMLFKNRSFRIRVTKWGRKSKRCIGVTTRYGKITRAHQI